MARHVVSIGDPGSENARQFQSKKEALKFCSEMLSRHKSRETITSQDSKFLTNLLNRHPDALQKIGCGVRRFLKDRADHGTECFYLERNDGSSTRFSFKPCVNA